MGVAYDSRGVINVQSVHTTLDIPKVKQMQIVEREMLESYASAETVQCIAALR